LSPDATGMAFRLQAYEGDVTVAWEPDPVDAADVDQAFAIEKRRPGPEPEDRQEAADWLLDALRLGPVEVKQLQGDARGDGISWATLRRAKQGLGVEAYRSGGLAEAGTWKWRMPAATGDPEPKALKGAQDALHTNNLSALGEPERLSENIGKNGHFQEPKTDEKGINTKALKLSVSGDNLSTSTPQAPPEPASAAPIAHALDPEKPKAPSLPVLPSAPDPPMTPPGRLDPDHPGPLDLLDEGQRQRYGAIYQTRPASMSPESKHQRAWRAALREPVEASA